MNVALVMNPQNAFLSSSGSVYMGENAEILKIRLEDYLRTFSGKKVFFREKHAKEDKFFITDKTHSIATTEDFQVPDQIKYCADLFYDKIRYNAFYKTGLEAFLKRVKATSVNIMGLETHTSVLFTAEGLRNIGYEVTLIEPCTMARDMHMHGCAISLMRNYLGIRIGT